MYCESTTDSGVQIFVVFVGEPDNELKLKTKRRFPSKCLLKTSKPQIQESTNLCIFLDPQKIGIHKLKYFHSNKQISRFLEV